MRAGCIEDQIVDGWRKIFQCGVRSWHHGSACRTPGWSCGAGRDASTTWDRLFDDPTSLSMTGWRAFSAGLGFACCSFVDCRVGAPVGAEFLGGRSPNWKSCWWWIGWKSTVLQRLTATGAEALLGFMGLRGAVRILCDFLKFAGEGARATFPLVPKGCGLGWLVGQGVT